MAEVVNLRQVRKAKQRASGERQAAANRARFGRTKEEKREQQAEAERNARQLDGARREPD